MTEVPNPNAINADTLTGELRPVRRGVISLGSNLGDRLVNLQGAIDSLGDTPDVWVRAVSPVYETEPVGAPEGSDDFYNVVVLIDTTLSGAVLMDRLLLIEDALGRVRTGVVNESRTLDVDVIVLGDLVTDDPHLTLPHPRAHQRAFVLQPWHDVEPSAELPGRGAVADLLTVVDVSGVARKDDLVLVVP